jgi:hypothetical protein
MTSEKRKDRIKLNTQQWRGSSLWVRYTIEILLLRMYHLITFLVINIVFGRLF